MKTVVVVLVSINVLYVTSVCRSLERNGRRTYMAMI